PPRGAQAPWPRRWAALPRTQLRARRRHPAARRPADRGAAPAGGETQLPYNDASKQRALRGASRWLTDRSKGLRVRDGIHSFRSAGAAARTASRCLVARSAQEVLDLVTVGARELQLVPALEREEIFPVHMGAQAPHQAQVDDGGAVHALEELRVEDLLELLHCAAQDMRVTAGMDAHVIPGSVDPLDRGHRDAQRLAALADRQPLRAAPLDRLAALGEQLVERQLPAAG